MAEIESAHPERNFEERDSSQSGSSLSGTATSGPQDESPNGQKERLTVVGIGASAGGLPALQTFFNTLPPDTGMAFVVVTHLHPERESLMDEILQLRTSMPVRQVNSLVPVEPNHVYIIPPNRTIQMTDTHLVTGEFVEPRGLRLPIDTFFRSLASVHRDAIGVILSGGGTDGSVGMKAIKEQGGLLLVQHPDEAEFDSMPRAAIATGVVDAVLPVRDLALKLVGMRRQPIHLPERPEDLSHEELETVHRLLAHVQVRTGHDFSQYKPATTLRRIQRRMQITGLQTLGDYLNYLRHNADEARAIFSDLLIGVTNFFRDAASWQALADEVIPQLFVNKTEEQSVRVWSIGCATGEEAYTLAILLAEHAATLNVSPPIQVFASDLDEQALVRAREAIYPAAIEADISAERLKRFFIVQGDYYRVRREVRDMVLFAPHSVLRDPPFSRVDLISCRNLLIYLRREIQENVFEIFHYALNPGGYLFLGGSESVESLPKLFQTVDKSHRIYQAKPWQGSHPNVPTLPLRMNRTESPELITRRQTNSLRRMAMTSATLESLHRERLEASNPPSILIDEEYNVLHVSETAGRFLLTPQGPLTSDLLLLVRSELKLELRSALYQAFENNRAVISQSVAVQFNGHPHRVILSVRPYLEEDENTREKKRLALVFFLEDEMDLDGDTAVAVGGSAARDSSHNDNLVKQLEQEVRYLRERLQATVEDHESASEEMNAANEELQSINEEYRSATEELKNKLEEISRAHSDLENLMEATEIATLFLDRDLRIQRYTPNMAGLFNIRASDWDRPIEHLTHKLAYDNLAEEAHQVLRQLIPIEHEVRGREGEWFLLRLRPYRTVNDKIDGVVMTLVEVTQLKDTEAALRHLNDTLEEQVRERTALLNETNQKLSQVYDLFFALFHANPVPTALTRLENSLLLDVNEAYLRYFGYEREEIIGRTPQELAEWLASSERDTLIDRVRTEGRIRDYEIETGHPSGDKKVILLSLQHLVVENAESLIYAFIDITERVQAEQQIKELVAQLSLAEQEERQRLSQILHNDLQQRLYAIQVQFALLRDTLLQESPVPLGQELTELETWLKEAVQLTRSLSIDLSPPLLEGEGLRQSISWLALQMKEQHNLTVTVDVEGQLPPFDLNLHMLLFEAVRELLFNIVKHANVAAAQVKLEHMDGALFITVSDEGDGFDAEAVINKSQSGLLGHGLLKLRQRLKLMGSEMEVNSIPGDGTQITIRVPMLEPTE